MKFQRICIPVNINWVDALNEDNTLKDISQLKEIYKEIDSSKEIIVYCHSGMRASYGWFVLSKVLKYPMLNFLTAQGLYWNLSNWKNERQI
ncbi:hypothetical protein GOV14_06590 [Candidatus Pacearchaeota archaeon]|nr:hypothetical protein [Candidatus Pacearchaeota archaeon]